MAICFSTCRVRQSIRTMAVSTARFGSPVGLVCLSAMAPLVPPLAGFATTVGMGTVIEQNMIANTCRESGDHGNFNR